MAATTSSSDTDSERWGANDTDEPGRRWSSSGHRCAASARRGTRRVAVAVPQQVERLAVAGARLLVGEHDDVVRLGVQPADREVGTAGEDLHRPVTAAHDEHLVVLEAGEVTALDEPAGRLDAALRLRLGIVGTDVLGTVVEHQAHPPAEGGEPGDDAGLVEVVRQHVEAEVRVGADVGEDPVDQRGGRAHPTTATGSRTRARRRRGAGGRSPAAGSDGS